MKLIEKSSKIKFSALTLAAILAASNVFAAGPPKPSELNNSLAIVLLVVAVSLLLAIGMLSYVVIGAARYYVDKLQETKKQSSALGTKSVFTLVFCFISAITFAADESLAVQAATSIGGLATSSFYMLVSIIGLELLVMMVLLLFLKQLLAKEVPVVAKEIAESKEAFWKTWWMKLNSFRPASEEKDLELDHDYDGIRELDNRLPPWWLYGFYITIIFSAVYLYRFHITETAPSTVQEYEIAMIKAEEEKEAYLKSAANNIDENTVTLITDAAALGEGKKLFGSMCAACHGAEGQGTVGPNLTDEYWIHKGGIKDIFKTIKYGVPEKGMKSWKDDFSPSQLAAITSYIKTLQGTKPVNAKEPQGDVYKDEETAVKAEKKDDKKLVVN